MNKTSAILSTAGRPVTRSVYVIVLKKDQPSPLAPVSDEEKGKEVFGNRRHSMRSS
jgi:hypothetical protein